MLCLGPFPVLQLIGLAAKQISKPIAHIIKLKAKDYPFFRKYICMPPAHLYNYLEKKVIKLNSSTSNNVQPLGDDMAVELGANLLGEFIIFFIGAILLTYDYGKQLRSEGKKKETIKLQTEVLAKKLADMAYRLKRHDAEMQEIASILADIVLKLGLLAIRQVSKPIANIIKLKAKEHPLFRNYICMPPAQFYNMVEVKMKMWTLHLGKHVRVPPLTEAMAVELGADLLGELVIFAIGASVLIFEYSRQSIKEAKRQEMAKLEKNELINQIAELKFRLECQDGKIKAMTRVLGEIGPKNENCIKLKEATKLNS